MDILVYKFCVEVSEKTLSLTKMIDHSFKRKYYGAYYVKNVMRGFSHTKRMYKVLKWGFHYDAIYQSVRKLHHSIFSHFLTYCWILKTVNDNNNCSLRNDNYNKNYFRRYGADYAFLHISMKKILNRFTAFHLPVNEWIKEIVRKTLNFSKLINYY